MLIFQLETLSLYQHSYLMETLKTLLLVGNFILPRMNLFLIPGCKSNGNLDGHNMADYRCH